MQFQPLANIVKLNIEISMAGLIVKVAKIHNQANVDHGSPVGSDIGQHSSHIKSRTGVGAIVLSKRNYWSRERFNTNTCANGLELGYMTKNEIQER
ncbi:hypothetical protein G7054_g14976 [Neopestalotiopsis clavispora]|nr:hypothetical protein G7054_g14976 [Neopestalotiopsis clavispora]